MTDHEKLAQLMRSRRTADVAPMPREQFEEKFIEPLRAGTFWSTRTNWLLTSATAAFAAALLAFNLYWYKLPLRNAVPLTESASVIRQNFFFGERRLEARQIYPEKDTILFEGTGVTAITIPHFARVSGRSVKFSILDHNAGAVSVQMRSGAAVFEFPKGESVTRTLRIGENDTIQITGTTVYADADSGVVAILEGKTKLNGRIDFAAGQTYSIISKTVALLNPETRKAAESLSDTKLAAMPEKPAPAKELSLEEKIFRKYGNVHKVILKSRDAILVAKIIDAANQQVRLFTLSGPMYVSESEISSVQRLR